MQERPDSSRSNRSDCSRQSQAASAASSRRKSSRSLALKEMEAWATAGREPSANDFSRHSGQLMDNVTEQRMLLAKLRELSKERHKFMSQNAYEKKIFLDKQQKKSNVMREMLDGVTPDGKRKSWTEEAIQRRNAVHKYLEASGQPNARLAFLDRMDPTKNRDKPKDVQSLSGESYISRQSASSKAVSMPPICIDTSMRDNKNNNNATSPKSPGIATSRVLFPTEPETVKKLKLARNDSELTDASSISKEAIKPKSGRTVRFNSSNFRRHNSPARCPLPQPRSRPGSVYSRSDSTSNGPSTDPRYIQLTQSLSSTYVQYTNNDDITMLINKLDSLHLPPRRTKEAKPKITHRIQQFMKEAGFGFLNL